MLCPNCKTELKMTDRQGVEIDYCPQCRGIWLDKGELDKLIERSAQYYESRPPEAESNTNIGYNDDYDKRYSKDYKYDKDYYKHRRKKSFLGDFFDFD